MSYNVYKPRLADARVECSCCGGSISFEAGIKMAVNHRLPEGYWLRDKCPKCGGRVPTEAQTERYETARKLVIREGRREMRARHRKVRV